MSWLLPTVTASTMIADFIYGHKVRCHMGVVEIVGRNIHENKANPLLCGRNRLWYISHPPRSPVHINTEADA